MHADLDPVKKQREKELIDGFIRICPHYKGWVFQRFEENPDTVYRKDQNLLGFDSIIISDDQASVQCVYSPQLCQIGLPANLPHDQRLNEIETFFANKLFTHLRHYSLPTVLVFTLVDTTSTSFADLVNIAKAFKLPKLDSFNIVAYYICNEKEYVRIAEAKN